MAKQQKSKQQKRRQRQRALPSPNALAYTIPDAQSMCAPGKTKIYKIDKQLKAEGGEGLLFKDIAGRTMVRGAKLRELYGVKEESVA